jgi:hypothetical protein
VAVADETTLVEPPPVAEALAAAFPPGAAGAKLPWPLAPPFAVAVAEIVPDAPGVVVVADALAAPPLPPLPAGPLMPPVPPAPPVAVARLEPFPEASVVVVVADALAAPPLPPLPEPLAPAPPVANAEFVESEGLFAIALASPPLPPSPTPSNDPGITGTITVSAIAGEIATSAMNAADKSSFVFNSSSPDANSCYADHTLVS